MSIVREIRDFIVDAWHESRTGKVVLILSAAVLGYYVVGIVVLSWRIVS